MLPWIWNQRSCFEGEIIKNVFLWRGWCKDILPCYYGYTCYYEYNCSCADLITHLKHFQWLSMGRIDKKYILIKFTDYYLLTILSSRKCYWPFLKKDHVRSTDARPKKHWTALHKQAKLQLFKGLWPFIPVLMPIQQVSLFNTSNHTPFSAVCFKQYAHKHSKHWVSLPPKSVMSDFTD